MNGKTIANILLNLPAQSREWLINNVAPETLSRWSRQNSVALRPYRNLKEKVAAICASQELSELAKYENLTYTSKIS